MTDLFETGFGLLNFNLGIKALFFVILLFYILYSFFMLLRVRILSDTIDSPFNKQVQILVYLNLIIGLIGGFLALILILPA